MRNSRPFRAAAVVGAFIALGCSTSFAQFPPPPPAPGNAPTLPARDVEHEAPTMAERYGLSTEQAAKVRAILAEQAKKVERATAQPLPPDQALSRLQAIRDEEASRVAAVLTPEQRAKYAQDARQSLPSAPALPAAPRS